MLRDLHAAVSWHVWLQFLMASVHFRQRLNTNAGLQMPLLAFMLLRCAHDLDQGIPGMASFKKQHIDFSA